MHLYVHCCFIYHALFVFTSFSLRLYITNNHQGFHIHTHIFIVIRIHSSKQIHLSIIRLDNLYCFWKIVHQKCQWFVVKMWGKSIANHISMVSFIDNFLNDNESVLEIEQIWVCINVNLISFIHSFNVLLLICVLYIFVMNEIVRICTHSQFS